MARPEGDGGDPGGGVGAGGRCGDAGVGVERSPASEGHGGDGDGLSEAGGGFAVLGESGDGVDELAVACVVEEECVGGHGDGFDFAGAEVAVDEVGAGEVGEWAPEDGDALFADGLDDEGSPPEHGVGVGDGLSPPCSPPPAPSGPAAAGGDDDADDEVVVGESVGVGVGVCGGVGGDEDGVFDDAEVAHGAGGESVSEEGEYRGEADEPPDAAFAGDDEGDEGGGGEEAECEEGPLEAAGEEDEFEAGVAPEGDPGGRGAIGGQGGGKHGHHDHDEGEDHLAQYLGYRTVISFGGRRRKAGVNIGGWRA